MPSIKKLSAVILLSITIATILLPSIAFASTPLTSFSASQNNTTASAATNIEVTYVLSEAVPASNGFVRFTTTLDYTMDPGLNYEDIDFLINGSQKTLAAASPGNPPVGVYDVTQSITSYNNIWVGLDSTGPGLNAGDTVVMRIGTNATYPTSGVQRFNNPSSTGTYTLEGSTGTVVEGETIYINTGSDTVDITPGAAPEFSTYMLMLIGLIGGYIMYDQLKHVKTRTA